MAGVASLLLCSLIGVAGAEAGTPLAPPPVPKTGAYLGGFIGVSSKAGAALGTTETPAATTGYTDENLRELAEMSGLDAAIGHPLSIVHVYEDWGPAKRLVSNATLDALASTGAIPMINWNCGDSDADIVKGLDDHYITSYAKQLKAYGRPLFLRWYREPNLSLSSQWVHCAGGSVSTTPPCPSAATEGYVAAWQHIYDLFAAAGATNVAFVWNPGMGGQTGGYFLKCLYPGAKYVNWIGIDGYSRPAPEAPANPSFSRLYGSSRAPGIYQTLTNASVYGADMPILIGETGAVGANQAPFLASALSALTSGAYPQIHGFLYYDSSNNKCRAGSCDWGLSPGSAGLTELATLAQSPYFNPDP